MARRPALFLALPLLGTLLLAGCSGTDSTQSDVEDPAPADETTPAPEPSSTGPAPAAVSAVIDTALRSGGDLGTGDLIDRLGPPQRTDTRSVPNQYVENQIDTVRTLVYRGLEAQVYDVTGQSKAFLVRLVLRSAQYATPEGLRVGASEQAVLDAMGDPTRRDAEQEELIYQDDDPTGTVMVVRLKGGHVSRIAWEFPFT